MSATATFAHGPVLLRHTPQVLGRRQSPFARRVRAIGHRIGRSRGALLACLVVAVAVALGAMLRADERHDAPAPGSTSPRVVVRGDLRATVPTGWDVPGDVPRVPGLDLSKPIAIVDPDSGVRVIAGLTTAGSRTLLPAGFVAGLGATLPRPAHVRLESGLESVHYSGISHPGMGSLMDVYAAPTSKGILTVACIAETVAALFDNCFRAVSGVTLNRGWPLPGGPDASFRDALRARVAELESADAVVRRALSQASTAGEQARALEGLRKAYEDAARGLASLAPRSVDWPRQVLQELAGTSAAYAAFERSIDGSGTDYRRARARVVKRRAELRLLLDRVLSPAS
jgi:hypothetical protein